MKNPVFQLSILSQNDQPNPSCPGCSVGDQITATVVDYGGGTIYSENAPSGYPTTNFPINKPVLLPIPGENPPPTPTWFMEVTGGIEKAWFEVAINTPGFSPVQIRVNGSDMAKWVAANQKTDTNQIYAEGNCGIFGYAQENLQSNPLYWIYTITAGVCNPQVHPPL